MAIQTKQQKRAAFALAELKDKVEKQQVDSKLATFIVGMPNMILSNGIGQSMAFLMAKAAKKNKKNEKQNPEHEFVFLTIKKYLCENYKSTFGDFKKDAGQDEKEIAQNNYAFLRKFNDVSQGEYIEMQNETLRMLEWLKRYARAFEPDSKNKAADE